MSTPSFGTSISPTSTFVQSSAEAALHGKKALTPIIAGTISGTCIAVAWTIAAVVAIMRRFRRKRKTRKYGRQPPALHPLPNGATFILPPDPAVVEGQRRPGEVIPYRKREKRRLKHPFRHHQHSYPPGYEPGPTAGEHPSMTHLAPVLDEPEGGSQEKQNSEPQRE